MRIPSQFNEDNLYRRSNRAPETSQTLRRLIRLVVALALVVLVMKQASKPAVYRPFFGTQGSPGGVVRQISTPISGSTTPVIDPIDRKLANNLIADLPVGEQKEWVATLLNWQDGQEFTLPESFQALQSASDESTESLAWSHLFDSLAEPSDDARVDSVAATALLAALDDAAAARVVDGSVWNPGDFDAFYRYLDQANQFSDVGVAATGVLPLLQQPDVFRNQLVRVHGSVARCERIPAKDNVYGIDSYWQLWIRPDDGADRPLVAIVPDAPSLVTAVGPEAVSQDGPSVVLVGKFLKRLAYRSSIGADLAPVVVGRLAVVPLTPNEIPQEINQSESSNGPVWATLSAAVLVGIVIAVLTMYRTSVAAKRMRELRSNSRSAPDELFDTLAASLENSATAEDGQAP